MFDKFKPFWEFINGCDDSSNYASKIINKCEEVVIKECLEETGLVINNPLLLDIVPIDGQTWDLFYFYVTDFSVSSNGSMLEEDEIIDDYFWLSYDEIKEKFYSKEIDEDRTIITLLRFINGCL